MGGAYSGYLLVLLLFGGGDGWGLSGAGGLGLGSGEGSGNTSEGDPPAKDQPAAKDGGHPLSSPSTELRIEVLGDEPLKQLAKSGKPDLTKPYRIEGQQPANLYSLADLKKAINARMSQKPA